MNVTDILGRLLGLEGAQRIEGYEFSLAAPWAQEAPVWLLFACLALAFVAIVFYARYQQTRRFGPRILLALFRAAVLSLIVLILAEPTVTVTVTSQKRPVLWTLFDGTDSMAIADELTATERAEVRDVTGMADEDGSGGSSSEAGTDGSGDPSNSSPGVPSRAELIRALVRKDKDNPLKDLADRYRLRAFVFEGPEGVRMLDLSKDAKEEYDGEHLAAQLKSDGEVTALGAALDDLSRRHATANLAGLVIFSDFNQNAGPAAPEAARRLGAKVYAVGVGATAAADVAVGVQAPPHVKRGERGTITVQLRQQGLEGLTVGVRVDAVPVVTDEETAPERTTVGEQSIVLERLSTDIEFPYVPEEAGRFRLVAEVERLTGETVTENNRAAREIIVRDDFLRLLFVEYEPTWEWRFIKEVFHRDKLVGMEGFRTFLRSSDPRVRQTNPMFLPTMSPSRSEFFENDVIFLGDVPATALSPRFCEMADEFVRNFGGGLVVLAGPRFGLAQLAQTPLANLLPVKIDPAGRIADRQPFRLQLSPRALTYDFMQLGADEAEHVRAWDNLGPLPWYQPVERMHSQATVLAQHPTDKCSDGSPQPLIAVRRAGRGEVVYVAFNETWRLRNKYGERYYRQFWGQMIHRLGLSHELGSQKRFVVNTDRRRYQVDEQVLLTVEAYDEQFHPLSQNDLPERRLRAELLLPEGAFTEGEGSQQLQVTELRSGVFETSFPVFAPGEFRVRVIDPVIEEPVETVFQVTSRGVERQAAVRNVELQRAVAEANPGGRSYELTEVARLTEDIQLAAKTETTIEPLTLWNTWIAFGLVVFLLLSEWLLRKWVNLL